MQVKQCICLNWIYAKKSPDSKIYSSSQCVEMIHVCANGTCHVLAK